MPGCLQYSNSSFQAPNIVLHEYGYGVSEFAVRRSDERESSIVASHTSSVFSASQKLSAAAKNSSRTMCPSHVVGLGDVMLSAVLCHRTAPGRGNHEPSASNLFQPFPQFVQHGETLTASCPCRAATLETTTIINFTTGSPASGTIENSTEYLEMA